MKVIVTFFIYSFFPYPCLSQSQNDTTKKNEILPTDIYDIFKKEKSNTKNYISIKSKLTGQIIYEDSIQGDFCYECYDRITTKADSLYKMKMFEESIGLYNVAFELNNNKGKVKHRLNAACCWVKLGNNDKAFLELEKVVFLGKFYDVFMLESESCFKALHKDIRWDKLINEARNNLSNIQNKMNGDFLEN
ncbi:MAG: hypothetical protein MUF43_13170 [Flavobacterium sp.]|nr:hypothetical protein [Flavobacterium sp.]